MDKLINLIAGVYILIIMIPVITGGMSLSPMLIDLKSTAKNASVIHQAGFPEKNRLVIPLRKKYILGEVV